jgi:hypothetical protein
VDAKTGLLACSLALVVPFPTASAQEPVVIRPGDRVRVTAPEYAYLGTVHALQADTLMVEPDGWNRPVSVSLRALTRLDLREGSRWVQGAGIGGMIGGALGSAGALLLTFFSEDTRDPARGVAVGFAGGLVAGIGVGVAMAGPRWRQLEIHEIQPAPSVRRAAASATLLSLRF